MVMESVTLKFILLLRLFFVGHKAAFHCFAWIPSSHLSTLRHSSHHPPIWQFSSSKSSSCYGNGVTVSEKSSSSLPATAAGAGSDVDSDVYVMVNGMPGPMATAAAEACLRKGLKLSPVAMTGPEIESCNIVVYDSISERSANVRLVPSSQVVEIESAIEGLKAAIEGLNNQLLLVIDFTHPSAVNENCRLYIRNEIPFVMGTTGGDRTQLIQDVQDAQHVCVIAPNMGKQIVAMQSALEDLATKYPGAFAGYRLDVTESHQKTKADTSGTAKAVISSIQKLTNDDKFTDANIKMLRNDDESIQFGVPPDALLGHAFHTYTITSPDGSVQFQLQHNVVGRNVYAEGTADAVKFLAKKLRERKASGSSRSSNEQHLFSMIDVLKEGALE